MVCFNYQWRLELAIRQGQVFRAKWGLLQSRITEAQKAESPQSAGFRVILRQDYRVSVSNADCMAESEGFETSQGEIDAYECPSMPSKSKG